MIHRAPRQPSASDHTGIPLGEYELLKKIATGSLSNLYFAKSLRDDELKVTVKLLSKEMSKGANLRALIIEEAKLASSIRHPNVCRVYGYGLERGRIFVAREHVDGFTFSELSSTMKRNAARLKVEHTLALFVQVCRAVAEIRRHRPDLSQCDISPDNFMVTTDGVVKLLDIGGFTAASLQANRRGQQPQSGWQYASPEQARGEKLDARSEVFSLGTLLFEMLAGSSPFARPSEIASHLALLHDEVPCISTQRRLPRAIVEQVNKAMRKDPQERHAGASEFICALLAATQVPVLPRARDLSRLVHRVRQMPLRPSLAQTRPRRVRDTLPGPRRFALPAPKAVLPRPVSEGEREKPRSKSVVQSSRYCAALFQGFDKTRAQIDIRSKLRNRAPMLALSALLCAHALKPMVS